jgi:DCC1-like thiol-disulfide oxidoreductase
MQFGSARYWGAFVCAPSLASTYHGERPAVKAEDLTRGGLAWSLKERRWWQAKVAAECSVIGNVGSHCRDRLYGDDAPVASAVSVGVRLFPRRRQQSIVVDPKSPGSINSPHGLILFDGVCVLCSRGCGFVSNHDRRAYFRIVPMQLAEGRDWFRAWFRAYKRGRERYCSDSGPTKAYSLRRRPIWCAAMRSNVRAGTTHRSIAAIASAWLRRNVRKVCDDGPLCRTMYLETVDSAISKPSSGRGVGRSRWLA